MPTHNDGHGRKRCDCGDEPDTEKFMPLTKSQHQAIAKAEPKDKGKVIASLLRAGRAENHAPTSRNA